MPGKGTRLTPQVNKEKKRFTDATGSGMRPDQEAELVRILQQQDINQRAPGVSRLQAIEAARNLGAGLLNYIAPPVERDPRFAGVSPTVQELQTVNPQEMYNQGLNMMGLDFLKRGPATPQQASRFAAMEEARERARPIRDLVERDEMLQAGSSPQAIADELSGSVQASLDEITRGAGSQESVQAFDRNLRKLINFKREAGLPLTQAETREFSRLERSGAMQQRLGTDHEINQIFDKMQTIKTDPSGYVPVGDDGSELIEFYADKLRNQYGVSQQEIDNVLGGPLGMNVQGELRIRGVEASDQASRIEGVMMSGSFGPDYHTNNMLDDLSYIAEAYPNGVLPPSYERAGNILLNEYFKDGITPAALIGSSARSILSRTLKWRDSDIIDAYEEFLKDGRVFGVD